MRALGPTKRRLLYLGVLAVGVSTLGARAVHADMVATSRQPVPAGDLASRRLLLESDAMLHATARCVAKRAAGQSAYLLRTVPGSDDEQKIVSALRSSMEWCIPAAPHNGLGSPIGVLRGMLAEALYRDEFPRGVEIGSAAPAAAWEYPFSRTDKGDVGRMVLEQTGRCTVIHAPAVVAALLASPPFSDAESKQMAAVAPAVSSCLASGSTARMSRQALRGVLAEATYEYARATRSGSTSAAVAVIAEKK